ncbi:MAG: hypothetical protein COB61_007985 [Thiotrichales bacterium]|nr:hypothetical protein [Thiotrichales bacterium]
MRIFNIYFLTALLLAVSGASRATTDQERVALQRLYHELELSMFIIDEAVQAANPQDKQHIQYPQLKDDLNKILQGIADAVASERREPRSLLPINGDYQ